MKCYQLCECRKIEEVVCSDVDTMTLARLEDSLKSQGYHVTAIRLGVNVLTHWEEGTGRVIEDWDPSRGTLIRVTDLTKTRSCVDLIRVLDHVLKVLKDDDSVDIQAF